MTREEKAVVRAYIKMSYKKGWQRPTEYEMSKLVDNMNSDSRDDMFLFIDREWGNLMNKDKAYLSELWEELLKFMGFPD